MLVFALEGVRINQYNPPEPTPTIIKNQSKSSKNSSTKTVFSSAGKNSPSKALDSSIKSRNFSKAKYITARKLINNEVVNDDNKYPLRTYRPLLAPNDTYANQWWLSPTGMDNAWDQAAGGSQITTAVIDTGFALDHQEFSGRWATNSGESGSTTLENPSYLNCTDRTLPLNRSCNNIDDDLDGVVDNESGLTTEENKSTLNCTDQSMPLDKSCNNRDDDSNGLADDYRGWDFINYDRSPQAGETNPDGDGTYHGTFVAGILGATGNNNVGIAGIDWNTKILPIQALNDDSYGNSITVADAIYYAVERDVDIISISLGTDYEDPYLRQAILQAQDAGIIIVAAAGNDGCDCMVYPANYPEVLAVGSFNTAGNVSSFSSYGANLDLVAPGEDMTGPYWTKTNQTSAYASGGDGTSYSTPFVSGVLGLVRSYQPNASWDEIVGILMENSDRKALTAGSPKNNSYGFGFIKADSALNRSIASFTTPITYRFGGDVIGTESFGRCEPSLLPGSFLYKLTKSNSVKYTINQYEIRKALAAGWQSTKIFGVCVGLPSDIPETLRVINLNQEILNKLIK